MYYVLLFLVLIYQGNFEVCVINTTIGTWLRTNTRSCDIVQGHFILDSSADHYVSKLFSSFSNLKILKGCLYIKGFTGSDNLLFLSNLEIINCTEKAIKNPPKDVIYIFGKRHSSMGLNSLKNVTGPGQITIEFEHEYYEDGYDKNFRQRTDGCFSIEEIEFLVMHPQFNEVIYQPCIKNDPCLRLRLLIPSYTLWDIPSGCRIFVGDINIIGPILQNDVMDKLSNMEILIGGISIAATLFSSLDMVFKNLKVIYPYVDSPGHEYYGRFEATTTINIGFNRFLLNYSLPSYVPIRNLKLISYQVGADNLDRYDFMGETVAHPCQHLIQFVNSSQKCVDEMNSDVALLLEFDKKNNPRMEVNDQNSMWICSIILVFFGLVFAFLATKLLLFGGGRHSLSLVCRVILSINIIVISLAALESCIIYQRRVKYVGSYSRSRFSNDETFLPEAYSYRLLNSIVYTFIQFTAASKHAGHALIILYYPYLIIHFRGGFLKRLIFSNAHVLFVICLFIILIGYFYSNLFVAVLGEKLFLQDRDFVRSPLAWILFNAEAIVNVQLLLKNRNRIIDFSDPFAYCILNFKSINGPEDLQPDILGMSFPDFNTYCDYAIIVCSMLSYSLLFKNFLQNNYLFFIIPLLYLQLSANRIRWFIFDEIITRDYCGLRDFQVLDMRLRPNIFGCGLLGDYEGIIKALTDRIPYIMFLFVSFFCWRFASYECILGAVEALRKKKKETKITKTVSTM